MNIPSYTSIYNLGHKAVADLTNGPVLVEEKIDGSQISFGVIDGVLQMRSKGAEIYAQVNSMFDSAVTALITLAADLHPGWVYRGEYLRAPKHNTLRYSRVPHSHIIIFDINDGLESYLSYEAKLVEATRLGLETVPLLASGEVTLETIKSLLTLESCLGGTPIEGVVIKPMGYDLYGQDKKVLMGKYVSEAFKETHWKGWKVGTGKDIIHLLAGSVSTPARWEKMVQSLRESGTLTDSPRDIGPLLEMLHEDIEKEEADYIRDRLYNHFRRDILRASVRGFPDWYKQRLLTQQFEEKTLSS